MRAIKMPLFIGMVLALGLVAISAGEYVPVLRGIE